MATESGKLSWRPLLRRIVPAQLRREREIFLRLGASAGRTYARLRLLDLIGAGASDRRASAGVDSILFVCFGNIMRSPMAELMLREELTKTGLQNVIRVSSAGLHATSGKAAHPRALAVSEELGLSLRNHRAKQIAQRMVDEADAIFAMDFQNKAELLAAFPGSADKIAMLGAYGNPGDRRGEISDPFLGDVEATRRCYKILQTCIDNLAADLLQAQKENRTELRTAPPQKDETAVRDK